MDLVAEMLLAHLRAPELGVVEPAEVRPRMTARLTRLPWLGATGLAGTTDRVLNRFWDYPRWLEPQARDFDVFHIVDHSYAHLATVLPPGSAIVTCHDLDAFGESSRASREVGGSTARSAAASCGVSELPRASSA